SSPSCRTSIPLLRAPARTLTRPPQLSSGDVTAARCAPAPRAVATQRAGRGAGFAGPGPECLACAACSPWPGTTGSASRSPSATSRKSSRSATRRGGRPVASPVDWDLAERVAVRVAGREPLAESYHYARLARDFEEVTALAEELVERATGLRSASGPARARVVDRGDWVRANIASFGRLLRPLTDRMAERLEDRRGPGALLAGASRKAAAVEIGAVLGWMATRVLGQYDLLIIEDE